MNRLPLALVVFMSLWTPAAAGTCPGGICPPQQAPAFSRPQQQQQQQALPTAPANPSVLRICNSTGRSKSWGTGTIVDAAADGCLVLTVAHLFSDGRGEVTAWLPNAGVVNAEVLAVDPKYDLAALKIAAGSGPAIDVADDAEIPTPGENISSYGYGPDGRFAVNRGACNGYRLLKDGSSYQTLDIRGYSREGDSGGPMLNGRGHLVGVTWGTDGQSVVGTCCRPILGFVARFLSRRPAAIRQGNPAYFEAPRWDDGRQPGPELTPVTPASPAIPAEPAAVDLSPLLAKLDAMDGRIQLIDRGQSALVGGFEALSGDLDALRKDASSPASPLPIPAPAAPDVVASTSDAVVAAAAGLTPWVATALGLSATTPAGLALYGAWLLLRRRGQRKKATQLPSPGPSSPAEPSPSMPPSVAASNCRAGELQPTLASMRDLLANLQTRINIAASDPSTQNEARRLRLELENARGVIAQLEAKLASQPASVNYIAPAPDDGLGRMRRAMKAVAETYPAVRPWVKMIESAFVLQTSGETTHAYQ